MMSRLIALAALLPLGTLRAAEKKPLYDFETAADFKVWSNLDLPKAKEPPVRVELSADHATSGSHSLKLTFAGGTWPTITTESVSQDWLKAKTFHADVTASRHCVVGFTLLQEKSERGEGWDPAISRWSTTAFLKPGKNEVKATLLQPNDYAVHAKWGKVVRFEMFMYAPHEGESIHIDNIRLSNDPVAPRPKIPFAIHGTEWSVSGTGSAEACRELGRNLAHIWNPPAATTVEKVEADFREKLDSFKKRYPKAVLAIFRDGETGFDPAHPDKAYAGWKDAYWNSHGPDTAFEERARNRGKNASHEVFMRHRSPLMQVDFSSIPAGSNILAAQLMLVRSNPAPLKEHDPAAKPSMWVVEPCNRPWDEYEVNAFQYSKDKFWKDIGGFHRGDTDPDFLPMFLAFGPGRPGKVSTWDFANAVRYWTGGKTANHGFMLHGDAGDYMTAHTREAATVKDRPAVLVIYVPK